MVSFLTTDSVRTHGKDKHIRVAVYILGLHGDCFHNPYLCLLLVWTKDSGKVSVRADVGGRQEEGWKESFSVWLWRPGSCPAISVRKFGVRCHFG